jgi:acyl dehydratase
MPSPPASTPLTVGPMLTIGGVAGLRERSGQELGVSGWHTVTQAHIDAFAAATDDYERIHVDPARGAETPFGSTIAHGLYTLSLGPKFLYEIMTVHDVPLALNYGFDRVRFVSPLPVDSRVRMRATLLAADDADNGNGVRTRVEQVFEREGADKPICVAESIVWYFEQAPVPA